MNEIEYSRIADSIRPIIALLVEGEFESLVQRCPDSRLTASELRTTVLQYNRTLVLPPNDAFDKLDVVEVQNSQPQQFSVRFDLWTKEEGRSDLTIELTLRETGKPLLQAEIDDLHTL
jgi:hypothetical protein